MTSYKLAIRDTQTVIGDYSTMELAFNARADAESLDRQANNYEDDRYMVLECNNVK
ncbi:MAG: hypothetical protein WC343_11230 [Bacilli bacterium]|jgi:hypothetical protein